MADGRRPAGRSVRARCGRAQEGRGRGLRARRVPHRRLRRHVEGPDRRRALRPGHHGHDAPRELVHGQEPRRRRSSGVLIQQGVYELRAAGARSPSGRPRATRGRRSASPTSCTCRAACGSARRTTPTSIPHGPYPDHVYLYTGSVDSFHYAATRPQQWPPNTVGRYRNTDPVLVKLPRAPRRRETRRGLPLLPAARAVRQDRHPHDGHGDRPVRELPDPGLRARLGPRLGAPRQPLPAGRRLERRAHPARRLRAVREHARPRLASRPPPDLRRLLLDQRRRRASPCPARPTTCPAPAARRR